MKNGILIIDKPKGMTSFKAVEAVRRRLKVKKVGHTGTLDPMATGLLAICLGKATKISRFLTDTDKLYEGSITLGIETDTYDMEGDVVQKKKVPFLTKEMLDEIASEFIGEQEQSPPAFSAAKHKGVPLYKLARKGIKVKKEPKKIEIFDFQILKYNPPTLFFRVHCSKGTYIRTLAHEFGIKVGCGAVLSSLRRLRSGLLSISEAITIDTLMKEEIHEIKKKIIPVELVLSHIPALVINNKDALSIHYGKRLSLLKILSYMKEQIPEFTSVKSQYLRLMVKDREGKGQLVCISKWPDFNNHKGFLEILRVWNPN